MVVEERSQHSQNESKGGFEGLYEKKGLIPGEKQVEEIPYKGFIVYRASKNIFNEGAVLFVVYDSGKSVAGTPLTEENHPFRKQPGTPSYVFSAYILDTCESYDTIWSYSDFDQIFRFNAELMNPNKKKERFFWIIQRLDFDTTRGGHKKLILGADPTTEDPQRPANDDQSVIPLGKMNYVDRHRKREETMNVDRIREENIFKLTTTKKKKFLEKLKQDKLKLEIERKNREEAIGHERNEAWLVHLMKKRENLSKLAKESELNDKREARISVKLTERKEKQKAETFAILNRQAKEDSQRKAKIDESIAQTKAKREQEKKAFLKKRKEIDEKEDERTNSYKNRAVRLEESHRAYCLAVANSVVLMKRKEKTIFERRLEQFQNFSKYRTEIFGNYKNELAERERLTKSAEDYKKALFNFSTEENLEEKAKQLQTEISLNSENVNESLSAEQNEIERKKLANENRLKNVKEKAKQRDLKIVEWFIAQKEEKEKLEKMKREKILAFKDSVRTAQRLEKDQNAKKLLAKMRIENLREENLKNFEFNRLAPALIDNK